MPKTEINYDSTCFYKIVCKDLNIKDVYVGHTSDFRRRKNKHKQGCTNPNNEIYNRKVYSFIRDNGGWENWEMVLVDRCKCEDSLDAKKKERQLIEELHATLNQVIPSRTTKERNIENPELRKASQSKYYSNYSEKIKKYHNEYYHQNREKKLESVICTCGGSYCYMSKSKHLRTKRHILYLENNKE